MWALIRKETLENLRWLPLALLLTCSLTLSSVGGAWLADISPLILTTMYGTCLLSLGFGLLQSIPDERNGARAYLLHRGVSATQVFWAKTIVGFGLVIISVGIPLTVCGVWLSMRGVLGGPGRPLQILPPAVIASTALLLHPTVLLIIYRPARWLGSRVVPMLVPIVTLMIGHTIIDGEIGASQLWSIGVVSLLLQALMLAAARRAYVDLARQPAASSLAHRSVAVTAVVLAGMVLLIAGVGVAVMSVDRTLRPVAVGYYQVRANKSDGRFWLIRGRQIWKPEKKEYGVEFLNGAPLVSDSMPDISGAVPENFDGEYGVHLSRDEPSLYYGIQDIAYRGFSGVNDQRWISVVDRRGYLLNYERIALTGTRLGQVISRDGVRDPRGDWGRPFDNLFEVDSWNLDLGMFGDHHGVYRVIEATGELQLVIDRPLDYATLYFDRGMGGPVQVFGRSGSQLSIYQLVDDSGNVAFNEGKVNIRGSLTAALLAKIDLPAPVAQLPTWNVVYRNTDDWAVHGSGGVGAIAGSIAQKLPGSPDVKTFTVTAPPATYFISMRDVRMAALFSTPVPTLLEPLYKYLTLGRQQHKSLAEVSSVPAPWLPWVIAMFLCQGAVAAGLTWYAARRRGLTQRATWLWSAVGIVLGWAVPLSVLACYPRIVREPCSHCQKPRRVDSARCEHCQAEWERPQREGIEIIEHEFDTLVASR